MISNLRKTMAPIVFSVALVSMGFAPPLANAQTTAQLQAEIASLITAIQQLQAELSGTNLTAGTCEFSRDLTIGATGPDVTCLQTYLINRGFSIPAGATGYFGTETQAAVAAWQSANGVSPPAGYFGPISRAEYAALTTSTSTTTGTGTSTGPVTLTGGEADLTNYSLATGNDLTEGDTNQEIAVAKFNVTGGDINVQRVTVEVQATNTSGASTDPWLYLSQLSVYDGNNRIGSADVSQRTDWNSNSEDSTHNASSADWYSVDIPTSDVIREGSIANLSIRADAQNTIDTANQDQTFALDIPDQGIRAVDAAGVQEYAGSTDSTVTLGFNNLGAGDFTLREDANDPLAGVLVANANQSTDNLTVFEFDLVNRDDTNAILDNLTIHVTSAMTAANDIIRRATLSVNGQDYDATIGTNTLTFNFGNSGVTLSGNQSTTFTLTISLASQTGNYNATGESLHFNIGSSDVTAEGSQNGQTSTVVGSATSNTQTISVNDGVSAAGSNNSTNLTYNSTTPSSSYGTFTLNFNVTAVGDDIYVPATIAANTGSTTYAGVTYDPNMLTSTSGGTVSASLTSTARTSGPYGMYYIPAGTSESFTATVTIDPSTTGDFQVGLDAIKFSTADDLSGLQTLNVDQTQSQFHTDPLHIPNS